MHIQLVLDPHPVLVVATILNRSRCIVEVVSRSFEQAHQRVRFKSHTRTCIHDGINSTCAMCCSGPVYRRRKGLRHTAPSGLSRPPSFGPGPQDLRQVVTWPHRRRQCSPTLLILPPPRCVSARRAACSRCSRRSMHFRCTSHRALSRQSPADLPVQMAWLEERTSHSGGGTHRRGDKRRGSELEVSQVERRRGTRRPWECGVVCLGWGGIGWGRVGRGGMGRDLI